MLAGIVAVALWVYGHLCPGNRPGRAKPRPELPAPSPLDGIVELRACPEVAGIVTIVGVNASGRVVYTSSLARSRGAAA